MRKIPRKYNYTKPPKERIEKPILLCWGSTALGRVIAVGVRG